ncbi:hypothetical protein [Paenibacillus sp. sgz302251]|uniref:hypothetical protein n=1 Tax=Paenibacillus sp. sgz302251 TaxID=3414493 RepID=UPI003C7D18C4
MSEHTADNDGRKPYFVSVQAGQILEDPKAAAYELEVFLNEEEHIKLRELLDELSSMDEAQTFHFAATPFETNDDNQLNAGYDGILQQIYRQLYENGTDKTKQHIESMQLL